MKRIYSLVTTLFFGLTSSILFALTPQDTITFDLSQSEFATQGGVTYMEFPVILRTDDPAINAVDFWFQFDLNKLTYVSTTSTVSTLDVYSNYNVNNQFLSNTSSTTSINVYLPAHIPIMKLKFSLNNPCSEILDTDFYAPTALLNGIVSSYLFIPASASPETAIEITTPEPHCPGSDVGFSYASETNGQAITAYAWDFGNGQTSNDQNTSTSFSNGGVYTITLETTTISGCTNTETTQVEIEAAPTINFSSTYDADQNSFIFTNQSAISEGTIVSYFWEFGDGQTSDLFEPTHQYATEGLYNVTLTATSDLGCSASFTSVVDAPIPVLEIRSLNGSISLFPNPANHELNISTLESIHFYIVDETGRRVSEEHLLGANQNAIISVDHLSSGLYSLVGYHKNGITNMRFLVQH